MEWLLVALGAIMAITLIITIAAFIMAMFPPEDAWDDGDW